MLMILCSFLWKGAQTLDDYHSIATIVTRVLPSRDSEIRGAIVRIAKINTILECLVNKLFAVENTYHDTNQTDKAIHKETASPFPCCPVNREYLWKKNQIEKKQILFYNI